MGPVAHKGLNIEIMSGRDSGGFISLFPDPIPQLDGDGIDEGVGLHISPGPGLGCQPALTVAVANLPIQGDEIDNNG